jgi:hypothetical protein
MKGHSDSAFAGLHLIAFISVPILVSKLPSASLSEPDSNFIDQSELSHLYIKKKRDKYNAEIGK